MEEKKKYIDLILSPYKKSAGYKPVWTITDSYIPYKEELKDLALDKKLYIKCFKEFFWELGKDLIRELGSVALPFKLGDLGIRKRKNNKEYTRQRIDFKHYNETKQIVYHCNNHTNKYYFFWDWDISRRRAFFVNQNCYKLTPARGNDKVVGKRGLAQWIKHCATDPNTRDYDRLIK
jgi:hypothetical protein